MHLDLARLATELSLRFPDVLPVEPLTVLGSGFASLVVETPSGVVFRIARNARAGERFEFERRLLEELAPYLPASVPQLLRHASDLSEAPNGLVGYRKIDGTPLGGEHLEGESAATLARDVGRFLAALHAVATSNLTTSIPVREPTAIGFDDWHATLRDALSRGEFDALHRRLDRAHTLLGAERHVLCHGDFWYENLLISPAFRLVGVLDWGGAATTDPAWDLAPLRYNGEPFLELACDAYANAIDDDASALIARSELLLLLRELSGLRWAVVHDATEVPDAVRKVRGLLALN